MKVLPRGPIIRISAPFNHTTSPSKAAALGFARHDWATGRDVSSEERRCGMLLTMREVATRGAVSPDPVPLLNAVVKGQTSDFQVNEINSSAVAAFLTKQPKGRWRKISRQKSLLVENAAEPFSNPDKSFTPLVQSYGDYVRLVGRLPAEEPVLNFVMYRDGGAMPDVLNRFRYEIGVEKDAVKLWESPGGFYGCISQFGTCVGVTKEQLAHVSRHYNLHPLMMDPRGYHSLQQWASLTSPPKAYFYRILLRCVDGQEPIIVQALRRLKEVGFINYFGMEHFGLSENALFDLAAFASRGDWHHALGCYLQSLADTNPFHYDHFMAYVNAEPGSSAGIAEQWAAESKGIRATREIRWLLQFLHKYHAMGGEAASLEEAWKRLAVEETCRRSAAEFVWNAMASQRLLSHGGEVVVGDVVRVSTDEVRLVQTLEEAQSFSIDDVVLPVPYTCSDLSQALFPTIGPLTAALFEEFAQQHHLSFLFSRENSASSGRADLRLVTYRHVVRKPSNLSASIIYDPSSFSALKSDLFMLQERKAVEYLDLDFVNRVREPSVYNISERFAEHLALVRQSHSGDKSVVLSFVLPSDTSPLVALREVFALKYLHFTDLYFTQRQNIE